MIASGEKAGILVHYLRYLGGNVLVIAAGFISFPVMTRLLDIEQFGLLGYYEAWLLVVAGLLKLGTQHAILRFYPHAGDQTALRRFRTDYLLVPFAASLLLWIVCVVLVLRFLAVLPDEEHPILWVMMISIPILIWCSFVEAVMYALERSDISIWLKASWRWSELGLVMVTIVFIERSALGVFSARLGILTLVAIFLTVWFLRWCRGRISVPTGPRIATGLAFGLPMMFTELTSVLFGFADRILLRALTGSFTDVGIYTIGYGLAMAVAALMGKTLNEAFAPTAMRLYKLHGNPAVVALKRDMLNLWVLAVGVTCALLLCVGQDFLVALAGQDKAASGPVFVAVAMTMVWYSLFSVAQYGLLLERKSMRYFLLALAATVLNLALNVPLILAFGVAGAVTATVISYAFLSLIQMWACPPGLRYLPPLIRLLPAAAFAPFMLGVLTLVNYFGAQGPWMRLLAGSTTILLPIFLLAALNSGIRKNILRMVTRSSQGAVP